MYLQDFYDLYFEKYRNKGNIELRSLQDICMIVLEYSTKFLFMILHPNSTGHILLEHSDKSHYGIFLIA